jgi:adenine-specific DNA-methyltransferase
MAKVSHSLSLFDEYDDLVDLNVPYLVSHLITYIGNKRKLLPFLNLAFIDIKNKLGKERITSLDGFSGSVVVSRLLKNHSSVLISNDLEGYAETINKAYLTNRSQVDFGALEEAVNYLNAHKLDKTHSKYFITKNYSPKNDQAIKAGERVFYTTANAKIIDNIRYLIDEQIAPQLRVFCLANLLVKASIHTNTSGVFKGFHKSGGVGHFGGHGEHALARIKKEISLETPIFSNIENEVQVRRADLNILVDELPPVDLAYYDPPYNQHPYGSNYFMLNIINEGGEHNIQEGVSGIAKDWKRSAYNKQKEAVEAMDDLLAKTKAKFIAISYNNEGIIPLDQFQHILDKHGKWQLYEQEYNTYRGSRNLKNRNIKVQELLWVLRKK